MQREELQKQLQISTEELQDTLETLGYGELDSFEDAHCVVIAKYIELEQAKSEFEKDKHNFQQQVEQVTQKAETTQKMSQYFIEQSKVFDEFLKKQLDNASVFLSDKFTSSYSNLERTFEACFTQNQHAQERAKEQLQNIQNLSVSFDEHLQERLQEASTQLGNHLKENQSKLETTFKASVSEALSALSALYKNIEQHIANLFNEKIQKIQEREEACTLKEQKLESARKNLETKEEAIINDYEARLLSQKNNLNETIQRLRTENAKYARQVETLESKEKQKLIEELEKYKGEFQKAKESYDQLAKDMATMEYDRGQEVHALKQKIRKLEGDLNDLKLDEEGSEKLKLRIAKIENEKDDYKKLYMDYRQRCEDYKKRFDGLRDVQEEEGFKEECLANIWQVALAKYPQFEQITKSNAVGDDELTFLRSLEGGLATQGLQYTQRLLYAFHSTLKSAEFCPLSVLAGVSGTGKSKLPEMYAKLAGMRFISEPVLPTWDSPQAMMGYFNMLENKFNATSLFEFLYLSAEKEYKNQLSLVLLDEMNLAHVEQYFAEFLSKFELRKNQEVFLDIKLGTNASYQLPLLPNTLYVGTINEDESTHQLSDKVIDRGYVLYFPRPTELKPLDASTKANKEEYPSLDLTTWKKWQRSNYEHLGDLQKEADTQQGKYLNALNKINEALNSTHRAIGHRVYQAMQVYMYNYPGFLSIDQDKRKLEEVMRHAFEDAFVLKIVPKLAGLQLTGKEEEALNKIKAYLTPLVSKELVEDFDLASKNSYGRFLWVSARYLDPNISKNNN
ncbi:hypothetical protein [Helicobacter bizzozeronii]|uniref:hypothetical protein n=1 Tax=Helicobacter bizzozeronii TaxID=56877 RepID=UPI000CEF189E|nr:hypothetical protein [Helicobacter bizzozeronii]